MSTFQGLTRIRLPQIVLFRIIFRVRQPQNMEMNVPTLNARPRSAAWTSAVVRHLASPHRKTYKLTLRRIVVRKLPTTIKGDSYQAALLRLEFLTIQFDRTSVSDNETVRYAVGRIRCCNIINNRWNSYMYGSVSLL